MRSMTEFQSALRFAVVSDMPYGDSVYSETVSIRFKVRGGFRRKKYEAQQLAEQVSIRFKVRGGFRRLYKPISTLPEVSIRFKVRGGFRPYPLARCPDKPCCGGFTHHPYSPPPTSGQNLSSEG